MGAVPWCGAGFPLEMSPAHQGTAPEGLDLNYGWNFLLILYPEEYQIPDREGWEDVGREESLERWICWEGSTRTTGKSRCFGVGFLFLSPAAALGWGQTKEPGFQRTTQIQPPPPIPTAGSGCRQVLLWAGWVLHNFRKSRSRI